MADMYSQKVILLTGASRGIGRALAEELISRGARVAALARSGDHLHQIAKSLEVGPERFLPVTCDLQDSDAVLKAVSQVYKHFGCVDMLINNAGIGTLGPALDTDPDSAKTCLEVNYLAAVTLIEKIAPRMIEAGSGVICNITSIAARVSVPSYAPYSAAKAALAAYSQALRLELELAGVRVLTIYPGAADTDFHTSVLPSSGYQPVFSDSHQSRRMPSKKMANTILRAIENDKNGLIIGTGARILYLLDTFIPSLAAWALKKEVGVNDWYTKKKLLITGTPEAGLVGGDKQEASVEFSLLKMDKPCQYHKAGTDVAPGGVVPAGLDPLWLYILYPYLLATVYKGKLKGALRFRYPYPGNDVQAYIERTPASLEEKTKNVIKTGLAWIRPLGRLGYNADIVIGQQRYPFDLGSQGTVCPAAFRSLFPFAVAAGGDQKNTPEKTWKACCPDHLKCHTFGSEHSDDNGLEVCEWGKNALIEPLQPCQTGAASNGSESLEEYSQAIGIPCPVLLNVIFAYYLTLATGGELAFYSPSFDAAIFQCPCSTSRVVAEIKRTSKHVSVNVLEVIGEGCPRNIIQGNKFILPSKIEDNARCLHAFNFFFLAAGKTNSNDQETEVRCGLDGCAARWNVKPCVAIDQL